MNTTKIGWIGLGNMGIPMAQQLLQAGYPLTIYNRSTHKEAALREMGAAIANSPATLLQETTIVFIMVSDDAATRTICSGDNGLLKAGVSGKTIINMSTVSPAISKERITQSFCRTGQSVYRRTGIGQCKTGRNRPAGDYGRGRRPSL